MNYFEKWCADNYLSISNIKGIVYAIDMNESKEFFILLDDRENIVDKGFNLRLNEREKNLLSKYELIKYVVFSWGGRYYYENISERIEVNFNELLYIGKPNISFDRAYSHLGVHTHYELMNGVHGIDDYIKKAKFFGEKYIGICDYNTLGGTLSLQYKAKKAGLKGIVGMSLSMLYNTGSPTIFVKLYVVDYKGWRNLLRINKIINVDRDDKVITCTELHELGEGLICVFDKREHVDFDYKEFSTSFHSCYFQIDSVIYSDSDIQLKYLKGLQRNIGYFTNIGVKPVLIDDCYYVNEYSNELKSDLNNISKHFLENSSKNQYFKCLDTIALIMRKYSDSSIEYEEFMDSCIYNANIIAETCDFEIPLTENKLPVFKYDGDNELYKNIDNVELFTKIIYDGIKKKCKFANASQKQEYIDRVKKEYEVITRTKFVDYFLITWDIFNYARREKIVAGVGRGSVGGSLISYLMDITNIDPIQYDLLFERFLNIPSDLTEDDYKKIPYPDIDCDFSRERRHEIKEYIYKRYGYDQVCSIGAYGSYRGKAAFKDVMKREGFAFQKLNELSKYLVKEEVNDNWKDIFISAVKSEESNKEFKDLLCNNTNAINKIKDLIGTQNSNSIHASAVLIVPRYNEAGERMSIFDWLPITKQDGALVSQWCGVDTEKARFLKEDILGLEQLDKFDSIIHGIKENQNIDIILDTIPMDSHIVYEKFSKGINEDIFQFNKSGIKKYCKFIRPDNIEDLIAINALYRPGPMGLGTHLQFGDIKHGRKEVVFDYGLESVTNKTYGLYVYQEQIMQAVVVLGGLTLVEADNVRQAIKKHDKVRMGTLREMFISGAKSKGCPEGEAVGIWNKLDAFSKYGFNRSHSAAYSLMAYWAQWLKVNYPLEFWTTSLNYCEESELFLIVDEMLQDKRIKLLPADINKSSGQFTNVYIGEDLYKGDIISGFRVKGLGEKVAAGILVAREKEPYQHLDDFIRRTKIHGVNKTVISNLILAGCFDSMYNITETTLYKRYDVFFNYIKYAGGTIPDEMLLKENNNSNLYWQLKQREVTGIATIDYSQLLSKKEPSWVSINLNGSEYSEEEPNEDTKIVVAGELDKINISKTKRGAQYASYTLKANGRVVSGFIFEKAFNENKSSINELVLRSNKKGFNLVAMYGSKCRMKGNNTDHAELMTDRIKLLN